MSEFLTTLCAEAMVDVSGRPLCNRDGRRLFSLLTPLVCRSDLVPYLLVAEAGFITDYGSVPRLPLVYAVLGDIAHEPYVIHDMLYSNASVSRELADKILKEMLMAVGIPEWKCDVIYEGVRLGGESHYG